MHSFGCDLTDGCNPWAGVTLDKAGNLYGATRGGGKYGNGVVFKLAPTAHGEWKETILHAFKGGSDGSEPFGTPVFDPAGNLYGTTYDGGNSACAGYGCGTIFKLTPRRGGAWKETVLHRFTGDDGSHPDFGSLAIDPARAIFSAQLFWADRETAS